MGRKKEWLSKKECDSVFIQSWEDEFPGNKYPVHKDSKVYVSEDVWVTADGRWCCENDKGEFIFSED